MSQQPTTHALTMTDVTPAASAEARALLLNGFRMSAAFAVNEGALLAVISLSAALVQPRIAALGNALLYLAFSLGCLVSPLLARKLGDRRSLVVGTSAYCAYVAAFTFPSAATVPLAATLAGGGGALLWTAQGRYFALNARLYSKAAADVAEPAAVARFATQFATLFPATVALFKALTALALLLTHGATPPVYAGLAAAAFASVLVMSGVADLHDTDERQHEGVDTAEAQQRAKKEMSQSSSILTFSSSLLDVARAHRDSLLLLMLPTNVAFGLCTAFFPYTVTLLAKHSLGAAAVGWLYALSNAFAALAAAAYGAACARWGAPARRCVMCVGAASFAAATGAVFASHGGGAWSAPRLACIFMLYGSGVAVWQGTVMAFFGEAWPGEEALPAFACLKLHSGLASAIAFFALPGANVRGAAAACLCWAVLGFVCYLPAEARIAASAARSSSCCASGGAQMVAINAAGAPASAVDAKDECARLL